MASKVALLVALQALSLLVQPGEAAFGGFDDFLPPLPSLPHNFTNVSCSDLHCGKGSCQASSNHSENTNGSSYSYSFGYSCQCDPGWTKSSLDFPFIPCVIPNCTLNSNCSVNVTAPTPKPPIDFTNFTTFMDPCSWAVCGAGTCVKASSFGYRCDCDPGYSNLLNVTQFPCYNDCVLGADCRRMGVGFANSTSGSLSPSGNSNKATAVVPGKILGLAFLLICLAMV